MLGGKPKDRLISARPTRRHSESLAVKNGREHEKRGKSQGAVSEYRKTHGMTPRRWRDQLTTINDPPLGNPGVRGRDIRGTKPSPTADATLQERATASVRRSTDTGSAFLR